MEKRKPKQRRSSEAQKTGRIRETFSNSKVKMKMHFRPPIYRLMRTFLNSSKTMKVNDLNPQNPNSNLQK